MNAIVVGSKCSLGGDSAICGGGRRRSSGPAGNEVVVSSVVSREILGEVHMSCHGVVVPRVFAGLLY